MWADRLHHPRIIGICGHSGSGKTTLLEKLIPLLQKHTSVACLKSDAHGIEIDKPGKDSWRLRRAGADIVLLDSQEQSALMGSGVCDLSYSLSHIGLVLAEGWKSAAWPRLLFLDDQGQAPSGIVFDGVIGTIVCNDSEDLASHRYHRDNIAGISDCILQHFRDSFKKIQVKGLVLAGGKSRRMGHDKALIKYRGRPQIEIAYDMAAILCKEVFVSCRSDQNYGLPTLHDRIHEMGPLGGILSALMHDPAAAWLVLACDLPHLQLDLLQKLIASRNIFLPATAYASTSDGKPEPLCAIWEPECRGLLFKALSVDMKCPRRILMDMNLPLLLQPREEDLHNCNHPKDVEGAKLHLQKSGGL